MLPGLTLALPIENQPKIDVSAPISKHSIVRIKLFQWRMIAIYCHVRRAKLNRLKIEHLTHTFEDFTRNIEFLIKCEQTQHLIDA
jgi:hypothetical protein